MLFIQTAEIITSATALFNTDFVVIFNAKFRIWKKKQLHNITGTIARTTFQNEFNHSDHSKKKYDNKRIIVE